MDWIIEARLMEKFHYSKTELDEMDWEQYIFLIGFVDAEFQKQKKDMEKAKKDAERKGRKR